MNTNYHNKFPVVFWLFFLFFSIGPKNFYFVIHSQIVYFNVTFLWKLESFLELKLKELRLDFLKNKISAYFGVAYASRKITIAKHIKFVKKAYIKKWPACTIHYKKLFSWIFCGNKNWKHTEPIKDIESSCMCNRLIKLANTLQPPSFHIRKYFKNEFGKKPERTGKGKSFLFTGNIKYPFRVKPFIENKTVIHKKFVTVILGEKFWFFSPSYSNFPLIQKKSRMYILTSLSMRYLL